MPEPSFEEQVAAALAATCPDIGQPDRTVGPCADCLDMARTVAPRVAAAIVEAAAMAEWDWREAALKALKGDA